MKFQIKNIFFVLFLVSCANASQVNLVLHKKYAYTPKPNYELTTDSLDDQQLTDGAIGESLWYQRYKEKTVGWFTAGFIEIIFDLGKNYNIDVVKVYTTGGGRSGVEYPEYIMGMASIDGTSYAPVSMVDSDSSKSGVEGLAEPKVMKLEFGVKCRYVKILVRPNGTVFFSDEVEVLSSEKDFEKANAPFLSNKEAVDYAERLRQLYRNISLLGRDYRNSGIEITDFSRKISQHRLELDSVRAKLGTVDELDTLERRLDISRAKFLKTKYNASWVCTQADPIDILRFADMPQSVTVDCKLSFYLWKNEYSLGAVNLTNCSEKELVFTTVVSPLAMGGQVTSSDGLITIRRACYVFSKNAGFFADPLVLQGNVPFTIRAGETVQLFIGLYSKNLAAGIYDCAVAIQCNGETEKNIESIPLRIEIADREFPEHIDFMTCNWDYITDKNVFTNNIAKTAANDLKSHYLNVSVIPPYKIFNTVTINGIKKIIVNSQLKNELEIRKYAKIKLLFFGLNSSDNSFGQDISSAEWKSKFNDFMHEIIAYMKNSGYDYNDYAIYPYDEYIGENFICVAQLIREIDPRIQIYANSFRAGIADARKVFGLVDIWCPFLSDVVDNKKLLDEIKKNCKNVWCYQTELREDYLLEKPGNLNKRYHRIMPMMAAGMGITGAGFWTYTDWGGGHYNYYDKCIYGVVYDGKYSPKECIDEPIVPSKRWQLWREGVEDAVCLSGRQDLLDEFFKTPNAQLTEDYITSLRKRADQEVISP